MLWRGGEVLSGSADIGGYRLIPHLRMTPAMTMKNAGGPMTCVPELLRLADELLQAGNYPAAVDCLKRALELQMPSASTALMTPNWSSLLVRLLATLTAHNAPKPPAMCVEVPAGELLDKIAILRIKSDRIHDPEKLLNIRRELDALAESRNSIPANESIVRMESELRVVNERLWDIEELIRQHEERGDFGPEFIELARAVYTTNDRRAAIKREINRILDSRLVEEKSYGGERHQST